MEAIKTEKLVKKYKDKTAVKGLELTVYQGELYGLLGVNGAGKSTTIKMLSCLTQPTSGEAWVMGSSIKNEAEQVKAIMNVSPQETAVAAKLSVRENLEFIARIYGCNKKESKEKARKIDKAVDAIRGKYGSDMIQRGSAMDSSARVGRKYKAQMDND